MRLDAGKSKDQQSLQPGGQEINNGKLVNIDFTKNAFAHILCILSGAYKEISKKIKAKNLGKII